MRYVLILFVGALVTLAVGIFLWPTVESAGIERILFFLVIFIFYRVETAIQILDALRGDIKKLAGASDTDKETTR